MAKLGQKVLLVDSDPQGHLTLGLGYPKNLRVTLKTMMENIIMGVEFNPNEAILHHEEGVDVVPSNKLLTGMDMSLITVEDREKVLKEYLQLLEANYDYIIIDCMPSLGMPTVNAMSAADSVLIPVQPQYYAADGLMELLKVLRNTKKHYNPNIEIEGILFTMDAERYNNSKRNKKAVQDAYGQEMRIFEDTIPRSEAIAETASEGISIFSYDEKSKGADSYRKLAEEYGVLNPALARPRQDGGYELIAGHRRKRASELNGFSTMPVIVREYTDDEAVLAMIDSNIQRENILPSEKAFAYKMKLDAVRHQGAKGNSVEEAAALVGKEAGDSGRKVQRYIRLTLLIPELLQLVDKGQIKVLSAVSLSFLSEDEQRWVLDCVANQRASVTGNSAEKLKKYHETGKLTQLAVDSIG